MIDRESAIVHMRAYLHDPAGGIWPEAVLEVALLLALFEYNLTLDPVPRAALKDLDGAAETTLPAAHVGLLLAGALGYALVSRATRRGELPGLDPRAAAALAEGGRQCRAEFHVGMAAAAAGSLHAAAAPPWPAEGFRLDDWDEGHG